MIIPPIIVPRFGTSPRTSDPNRVAKKGVKKLKFATSLVLSAIDRAILHRK